MDEDLLDLGWLSDTLSESSMPDDVREAHLDAIAWVINNGPEDEAWHQLLVKFVEGTNSEDGYPGDN